MKLRLNSIFESIQYNRKVLATIVTMLALMVAIGTTYTLISPAATLETSDVPAAAETAGEDSESVNADGLTAAEQAEVDRVIEMIDALPTYTEIEDTILAYEENDDMDGMETYYYDVVFDIKMASNAYVSLDDSLKPYVTNYAELQDLEGFAQVEMMIDEITSDKPTTVKTASTRDFIQLNLYDYNGNINDKYNNSKNISFKGYDSSAGKYITKYTSIYPGFQWNGGAYHKGTYDRHTIDYIDFGNSMITDYDYAGTNNAKSTTSVDVVINDNWLTNSSSGNSTATATKLFKNINLIDVDSTYGVTNRPVGMGLNATIDSEKYDVLQRTIGEDGYPALADGTSLAYLFQDGDSTTKLNEKSIEGLFQQDSTSGAYHYNSRENHAQYGSDEFKVYNQIITPNFIVYPFGNFLPLNDITNGSNATQVSHITRVGGGTTSNPGYVQQIINDLIYADDYDSNPTKQQLLAMLVKYRTDLRNVSASGGTAWDNWTAKNAIVDYFTTGDGDNPSDDTSLITDPLLNKMYNIDWDVDTNFFFGMEMKMNFMQPKDGMTGNDTNQDGEADYPMVFYFTGDDDVWVYIDDVLFLDLSGIHRHVGGEIDFVNGKVNYYYLDTANTGDVSAAPYKTYTFAELLSAAGKSTDGLNSNGTFKDYTFHKFNFYYMERGSGSSVCRLNFNFPLLKQNSISVSKEVTEDSNTLGNPDFKFQILKAGTQELFIPAGTEYTIYDNKTNAVVGTGTTDEQGIFTIKKDQRAEFDGIDENDGKYYVRELFDPEFVEQYDSIKVSGESVTVNNSIQVGSETFAGADSPVLDISEGTTAFHFVNNLDKSELGSMQIQKSVKAKNPTSESFEFAVTLDGTALPAGTEYTVTAADGTAKTETVTIKDGQSLISLKSGEKALISGIKAGTVYTVKETDASRGGYEAIYTGSNVSVIDQTNSSKYATGEIAADSSSLATLVKVTNTDGAVANVAITKVVKDYNGDRTYNFQLQESDSVGKPAEGTTPQKLPVQVTSQTLSGGTATAESQFSIPFELDSKPGTYYYKVTEVGDGDVNTIYDNTEFIVKVELTKDEDGALVASPSYILDGQEVNAVAFTNTQLYSLNISKTVDGKTDDTTEFEFTVTLKDKSGNPLTGKYPLTGSETPVTFDENGQAVIKLTHGESASINGLPAGAQWTVTEKDDPYDGYRAFTTVNGQDEAESNEAAGTLTAGISNSVSFRNEASYMLPEAGGIGTKPFYIGGAFLILAGAALLMRQMRRED